MRASARELNGALYVIAVNGGSAAAAVTLTAPQLAGRSFDVLGSDAQVRAKDDALGDTLPPLGVRIYVSAP